MSLEEQILERANELMPPKSSYRCDCGAGHLGHAPDCSFILDSDSAWQDAQEQAREELEGV